MSAPQNVSTPLHFAQLPIDVLTDADLSSTARLVYAFMMAHRSDFKSNGLFRHTQTFIAKGLKVSVRTVQMCLKELLAAGWVLRASFVARKTVYYRLVLVRVGAGPLPPVDLDEKRLLEEGARAENTTETTFNMAGEQNRSTDLFVKNDKQTDRTLSEAQAKVSALAGAGSCRGYTQKAAHNSEPSQREFHTPPSQHRKGAPANRKKPRGGQFASQIFSHADQVVDELRDAFGSVFDGEGFRPTLDQVVAKALKHKGAKGYTDDAGVFIFVRDFVAREALQWNRMRPADDQVVPVSSSTLAETTKQTVFAVIDEQAAGADRPADFQWPSNVRGG